MLLLFFQFSYETKFKIELPPWFWTTYIISDMKIKNHLELLLISRILNHGSKMPHNKIKKNHLSSLMDNFRRHRSLDRITVTKILKCFCTTRCSKWRNRCKIFNIWNSRHIAVDIEKKLANLGEVLFKGISHIYLSLSNNGNYTMEPSTVTHIISEQDWISSFNFTKIVSKSKEE